MMNIDLKQISKEELMKLWESENNVNIEQKVSWSHWLKTNDFGSEVMNDIGYEIGSAMDYFFINGDEESGFEKNNPNESELFDFSLKTVKSDVLLLTEMGIADNNKTTKNKPYKLSEIDWSVFIK